MLEMSDQDRELWIKEMRNGLVATHPVAHPNQRFYQHSRKHGLMALYDSFEDRLIDPQAAASPGQRVDSMRHIRETIYRYAFSRDRRDASKADFVISQTTSFNRNVPEREYFYNEHGVLSSRKITDLACNLHLVNREISSDFLQWVYSQNSLQVDVNLKDKFTEEDQASFQKMIDLLQNHNFHWTKNLRLRIHFPSAYPLSDLPSLNIETLHSIGWKIWNMVNLEQIEICVVSMQGPLEYELAAAAVPFMFKEARDLLSFHFLGDEDMFVKVEDKNLLESIDTAFSYWEYTGLIIKGSDVPANIEEWPEPKEYNNGEDWPEPEEYDDGKDWLESGDYDEMQEPEENVQDASDDPNVGSSASEDHVASSAGQPSEELPTSSTHTESVSTNLAEEPQATSAGSGISKKKGRARKKGKKKKKKASKKGKATEMSESTGQDHNDEIPENGKLSEQDPASEPASHSLMVSPQNKATEKPSTGVAAVKISSKLYDPGAIDGSENHGSSSADGKQPSTAQVKQPPTGHATGSASSSETGKAANPASGDHHGLDPYEAYLSAACMENIKRDIHQDQDPTVSTVTEPVQPSIETSAQFASSSETSVDMLTPEDSGDDDDKNNNSTYEKCSQMSSVDTVPSPFMQDDLQASISAADDPPANDLADVQSIDSGHANGSNVTINNPFLVTDIYETCEGKVTAETTV